MDHKEPHSSNQLDAKRPRLNDDNDENQIDTDDAIDIPNAEVGVNAEIAADAVANERQIANSNEKEIDAAVLVNIPGNAMASGSGVGASSVVDAQKSAAAPTVVQTGAIFKLDIDCFEEFFEYLSLADLVSVGKTCKRLQQVAGYCFQQNHTNAKIDWMGIRVDGHDVEHFSSYIRNVNVIGRNGFRFLISIASKLHRIKQIDLRNAKILEADIGRLKGVLNKIEVLRFTKCHIYGNIHELLSLCGSLKRFGFQNCKYEHEPNWIGRRYPTLEYFNKGNTAKRNFNELCLFLQSNPNIRKVAIIERIDLIELKYFCVNANIQVDILAIENNFIDDLYRMDFSKLHELGFYKKLEVYLDDLDLHDRRSIDLLATVNGLVKLYIANGPSFFHPSFELSALVNLEELCVANANYINNLEMVARNLVNLKRIYFGTASIDQIILFIDRTMGLKLIKVDNFIHGVHLNEKTSVIDLVALNRAREQVVDAEKVTILVKEKIFLATKWAMKDIDLRLIRLKLDTSFQWDHDYKLFGYFK